jgi:hypothetical protein
MTFKHLTLGGHGRDELLLIRVYLGGRGSLANPDEQELILTVNAKRSDLRGGDFHRKNQRPAEFGQRRLSNGALQYRNIRYWAADSCF